MIFRKFPPKKEGKIQKRKSNKRHSFPFFDRYVFSEPLQIVCVLRRNLEFV